jgi:hypothetical protein
MKRCSLLALRTLVLLGAAFFTSLSAPVTAQESPREGAKPARVVAEKFDEYGDVR